MFWYEGIPIDFIDSDALRCPLCGETYLHQKKIEIFARREDEETYQPIGLDLYTAELQPVAARNPSPRRQGIVIYFICEQCHTLDEYDEHDTVPSWFELEIFQHKGTTVLHWREIKHG